MKIWIEFGIVGTQFRQQMAVMEWWRENWSSFPHRGRQVSILACCHGNGFCEKSANFTTCFFLSFLKELSRDFVLVHDTKVGFNIYFNYRCETLSYQQIIYLIKHANVLGVLWSGYIVIFEWFYMAPLPILFRVVSGAPEQLCDCNPYKYLELKQLETILLTWINFNSSIYSKSHTKWCGIKIFMHSKLQQLDHWSLNG